MEHDRGIGTIGGRGRGVGREETVVAGWNFANRRQRLRVGGIGDVRGGVRHERIMVVDGRGVSSAGRVRHVYSGAETNRTTEDGRDGRTRRIRVSRTGRVGVGVDAVARRRHEERAVGVEFTLGGHEKWRRHGVGLRCGSVDESGHHRRLAERGRDVHRAHRRRVVLGRVCGRRRRRIKTRQGVDIRGEGRQGRVFGDARARHRRRRLGRATEL